MTTSVFADIVGQKRAISALSEAKDSPTHAWLFTGPPGCGRSNIAKAFAALLVCPNGGCGSCTDCQTSKLGSHPDVELFAPEGVVIRVDEIRELVSRASWGALIAAYRVTVIEDCDRMTDSASSALLKAIEEPGRQNIWLLCAPTADDVLPTIRSRCRLISLATPTKSEVSTFLQEKLNTKKEVADTIATVTQGHIGLARQYAYNFEMLTLRKKIISLFTSIEDESSAVSIASQLEIIASAQSGSNLQDFNRKKEEELRLTFQGPNRSLLSGGASALKDLEKSQKSRSARAIKDELDMYLRWLQDLIRDSLLPESTETNLFINIDLLEEMQHFRRRTSPENLKSLTNSVNQLRTALASNAAQLLALEAFCLDFRSLTRGR